MQQIYKFSSFFLMVCTTLISCFGEMLSFFCFLSFFFSKQRHKKVILRYLVKSQKKVFNKVFNFRHRGNRVECPYYEGFCIYVFITNSQCDQLPVGLIAQLVAQCTGITEVMGSNPVQA